MTAAELARLRTMLAQMQAEIDALKNRKLPAATTVVQQQPKSEPPKKVPGSMLFVSHDVKPGPPPTPTTTYTLAPGAGKLPCIIETAINSDVEGSFTAKVSTNVYDTATGRHLLVPQGSTILGRDHSQDLLYGNERLPTTSLTLTLPDGRSVDLGKAPITDQQGMAGLTGKVNNHYGRLFGAIFIGGALRGGVQAMQTAVAQEAGVGQVAAGYGSVVNQALSPRLGRALDTRPTIEINAGQICNVLLTQPVHLPAIWQ
jgi:type IV secretion system protein VirB10